MSGYNTDAFLYIIGNNFVEYHEFMYLLSDYSVFFFSNSNETFQYIIKKDGVKQDLHVDIDTADQKEFFEIR